MTRLREEDVRPIARRLDRYDARLRRVTGASLRQIACAAVGVEEAAIVALLDRVVFAAVPVSAGFGVIRGFVEAVAAIVSHIGFEAFVTDGRDVAGSAEGLERGARVLMLADDESFVAIVPGARHVVDNSRATARGFVAGLELMSGGLAGRPVLVLGCGPVGTSAATALIERGADVALCDAERDRALVALRQIGRGSPDSDRIRIENEPLGALERYELIFDASDAGGFIRPSDLSPRSLVAAPGLPCALTPEAMEEHRDRVLHDVLEIGTATMAVEAAARLAAGAGIDGDEDR